MDRVLIRQALVRFRAVVESLECACDPDYGVECSVHRDRRLAAAALHSIDEGAPERETYLVEWSMGGTARIAASSADEAKRIATEIPPAGLISACRGENLDFFEIADVEEEAPE